MANFDDQYLRGLKPKLKPFRTMDTGKGAVDGLGMIQAVDLDPKQRKDSPAATFGDLVADYKQDCSNRKVKSMAIINSMINQIDDLLAERASLSDRQAQCFLGIHATVYNLFNLGRHLVSANHYRNLRKSAFKEWSLAAT